MTLLSQLSDDQFALVSCGGALVVAFAVMTVSYHVGALIRRSGSQARDRGLSPMSPQIRTASAVNPERRAA